MCKYLVFYFLTLLVYLSEMKLNKKILFSLIYLLLICLSSISQTCPSPIAKFSFNNKSNTDEVSNLKAKFEGTNYAADRFGNENHAIFCSGNPRSYINLGTDKRLKNKTGTISLWFKLEHAMWSGKGVKINPLLITKSTKLDDFYESYAIYYMLDTKKLAFVCAKDSTKDIGVFSKKEIKHNTWQHLVIAYTDAYLKFYIDGDLQGTFAKNFETAFCEADSVLIGVTGNKKNERYFNGLVDDIEYYDKILNQQDVLELYNAPNPNKNTLLLNKVFIFIAVLLLLATTFFSVRYYIKVTVRKGKQRLELTNILLENELRINRALMNPHFIFNSLNTLNHYILTDKKDIASNYLVKFSKLIRKILESNMSDTISLEHELDLIHSYLEIEGLRFKESIHFDLHVDPKIIPSTAFIPIMMVQPFVENSVWHGLREKKGEKIITVSFSLFETRYIECIIEDNGTGRKKKEPNSLEKKSLATGFVHQRLELLNKIHNLNCSLTIIDKENHTGTIVKIILPILNK